METVRIITSGITLGLTIALMMKIINKNNPITTKRFFVFVSIVALASILGFYFSLEMKLILTLTAIILSSVYIFKYRWIRSLISTVVVYIITIISDIIIGLFFNFILNISNMQIQNDSNLLLFTSIIVGGLSILIVSIPDIYKIKFTNISVERLSTDQKILVASYSFLLMVLFILQFMAYNSIPEMYAKIVNAYNFLIFLVYFIATSLFLYINYYLIQEKLKKERAMEEYEELKLYTEIIENLTTDIRVFKHDYNNIMYTIDGYLNEKDFEGLREYFNGSIVNYYKKMGQNSDVLSLKYIQSAALKGLLTAKLNQALQIGVKVKFESFEAISDFYMDILDLCRMLGILIDNAIEESIKTEDKLLSIGFMKEDDSISIIVSNSFLEKPNIKEIFQRGYSTKGKGRGLGLYSLKEMLIKKYNHVLLNTFIEKDLFIQELIINKKTP